MRSETAPAAATDRAAQPRCGVLLVNLGTPDAPTAAAVRRYLAEFLHDHRVVDLTRWLWCPILHGVILRVRPARVARNYRAIWTDEGSPLLVHSRRLAHGLTQRLAERLGGPVRVELAMTYGRPAIADALTAMADAGVERLLVLPLYPQYSGTTTAAVFDRLARELRPTPWVPALRLITDYHRHPAYLSALEASVRQYWADNGEPERLLISFHGIPRRYHEAGDPYPLQCQATAEALAERLGLAADRVFMTYQSRFGREPWLEPYTDVTLGQWGAAGIGRVDVICPGFAADCLETLEEIAVENRQVFAEAGGGELHYIPALNERPEHIDALAEVVADELGGWPACPA